MEHEVIGISEIDKYAITSYEAIHGRTHNFGDTKVQRDMYSAFLIMNVDNDLKGINQQKCNERFDSFLKLHDIEVERLTGYKNLSSIAI